MVKGGPTEVSDKVFKEFRDLNKIIYAKVECFTSKNDGRVPQMLKLEVKDEAEAEALILQNLTCHITRWKNFGPQFQYSSVGIAKISAIWQKHVSLKSNV